ncbi:MAG: UpxY family transcription antiterminator [Balneolales bacterium]|nr:UpxY family transcription antiterminator [Balneolales bacterium]
MPEKRKLEKATTVIRRLKVKNEKPAWYALKTKPRAEKKLHERLTDAQIEHYLPLVKVLKEWSDRKKWIEEPMFRGYLFVFTKSSEFAKVLSVDGAVHFVRFNQGFAVIREDQIEFIRKVEENKLRYEVTEHNFEEGDEVEIIQGPLKGMRAIWKRDKSKYNVVVEIEQLSRYISIEIPAVFLSKISVEEEG